MRNINQYTEDYLKKGFEDYQVKFRKKNILENIKKIKPKRILEIGCGMSPLYLDIELDEIDEYYIVEPSEVFCSNAIKENRWGSKIKVVNDYFENVQFEANQFFDIVICSSLLHELANPQIILEHAKKVMNDDTYLYINVPNSKSFHRLLAVEMGLIKDEHDMSDRNLVLQQNKVFDMESLSILVCQCGYGIVESGSYFVKMFDHKHMENVVEIFGENILEGLYNMVKYMPDMGSEIFVLCKKGN